MPRETREVRNKRIALEAIGLIEHVTNDAGGLRAKEWLQHELGKMRHRWETRGVHWLRPQRATVDMDDWLTADEIADLADVTATTVRSWHYRGHITATTDGDGRRRYNVGEVVRYQAR